MNVIEKKRWGSGVLFSSNDSTVFSGSRLNPHKGIILSLILLSVAVVMLLVFTIILYGMKETEKAGRISIQQHLDAVLAAKQAVESKLRQTEIEIAGIKLSLKAEEEKAALLSKSLEDEKALSAKNAAAIQEKDVKIAILETRLADSSSEQNKLHENLQSLNYEHMQLKFFLENIMKTKEEMDKKAKEIAEKEGVSLGTIVVNQGSK